MTGFPFSKIRIARPTDKLEEVVNFYKNGLGLTELARFEDHEGYDGVMLGMPGWEYHLEFTQHKEGGACMAPGKDDLLVFYLPEGKRDEIARRIIALGYREVEPGNPYWKGKSITIEDPDRWRIVLFAEPENAAPGPE